MHQSSLMCNFDESSGIDFFFYCCVFSSESREDVFCVENIFHYCASNSLSSFTLKKKTLRIIKILTCIAHTFFLHTALSRSIFPSSNEIAAVAHHPSSWCLNRRRGGERGRANERVCMCFVERAPRRLNLWVTYRNFFYTYVSSENSA